jgi:hypothetical protein
MGVHHEGDYGWRDYDEDDRSSTDRDRDRERLASASRWVGRMRGRAVSRLRERDWDMERSASSSRGEWHGHGPYGASGSTAYGRSPRSADEHEWRRTESADVYDRTYGTHLGQGVDYGERYYGALHAQNSQQPHEGAIERFGHRVGTFVRGVFKRPFRGPKGYVRSDERIREDVCDALGSLAEADPSDVEVTVQAGEVILTGTVPYRHWKHQMEDVAESISGVRDVINNIRVRPREVDIARTTEDKSLAETFSPPSTGRRGNGNRSSSSS